MTIWILKILWLEKQSRTSLPKTHDCFRVRLKVFWDRWIKCSDRYSRDRTFPSFLLEAKHAPGLCSRMLLRLRKRFLGPTCVKRPTSEDVYSAEFEMLLSYAGF